MYRSFLLIFLLPLLGCDMPIVRERKTHIIQSDNSSPPLDKISKNIPFKSCINSLSELKLMNDSSRKYETVKASIKELQNQLKSKEIPTDSLSKIFTTQLLNRIIPFWEGTEWDFNGYTHQPQTGKIACGYFISTTLRDVGIPINRFKLAQQSPVNEATSIALDTKVIEIAEGSPLKNISTLRDTLKTGIHFIGLSYSHVGYLLKKEDELYIIHSNYAGSESVEIERLEESEAFNYFDQFYIAEISTNKSLLERWLSKEEIKIVDKFQF